MLNTVVMVYRRARVMASHKVLKTAARLMLTIAVIGTLVYFVNWRQVVTTLAGADLAWLLPAYVLVVVRRAIEALQQARVLAYVDCRVAWFRVFRANALAIFYGLFSPGSVIPMAVKWTDLAAATGKRAIVFNAMIYNRLMLDLLPVIFGAGALAWDNPTGEPVLAAVACGLAILGLVGGICLFAPSLGQPTRWAVSMMGRFLPAGLRRRLDRLLDDLEPFRAFPLMRHLSLAAIALASFAVGIVVRVMLMKALGFNVPVATIIWVDAILVVATHTPITFGNFGLREGLVIAAFGLYGVPADMAFAYGLLLYSCRLIIALVGGVYQLALITGLTTMRGNARPSTPD